MVIDRGLVLPIKAGISVGRVELSVDGQAAGSVDVVTSRAARRPTLGSKIARFLQGCSTDAASR